MPSNKCSNPQPCWYYKPEFVNNFLSPDGTKPKLIFNPKKAKALGSVVEPMTMRCRVCPQCLYNSSSEWGIRAACEMQMHKENTFITLTYAENTKYGNLIPEHFLNFIRRLKDRFPEKSIRYLYSGERGGKYGRPHFHAILFGIDFSDKIATGTSDSGAPTWHSKILTDTWKFGITQCGEANAHTAAYVAQYVVKKLSPHDDGMTNKKETRISTSVNKETGELEEYEYQGDYIGMSRMPGIGHDYFKKYKTDMFPSCSLHLIIGDRMRTVAIPDYFFRLLKKYHPEEHEVIKLERMKKGVQYVKDHPEESAPARLLDKATCAAKKRETFSRKLNNNGDSLTNPEKLYIKALKIKHEIDARVALIKECDFPVPRLLESVHSLSALSNPDFTKVKDYQKILELPLPDFYQKRRFSQIHFKNEAVKRLNIQIETKQKMYYEKLHRIIEKQFQKVA